MCVGGSKSCYNSTLTGSKSVVMVFSNEILQGFSLGQWFSVFLNTLGDNWSKGQKLTLPVQEAFINHI